MSDQTRHSPSDSHPGATDPIEAAVPLRTQALGPYHITGFIGRGGCALVYSGTDASGAPVALKIMEETPLLPASVLARFKREADASKTLRRHPNIITIYDTGQTGHTHFIAMELVPGGRTLTDRLKAGPLPIPEALRLAIATARALDYAHRHGIVHRDLKPSNILLSEFDEPLLADFGLARMESDQHLTLTQSAIGTPSYMAPEQTLTSRVDAKCDMYAFGVVLYQMLTGALPYDLDDTTAPGAIFEIIRKTRPQPPRHKRRQISRNLQAVIMTLLEKEPRHRYPSMAALIDDLQACQHAQPVSIRRPNLFEQFDRLVRRHWLTALFFSLTLLGVSSLVLTFRQRLARERESSLLPTLTAEKTVRELHQLRQSLQKAPVAPADQAEAILLAAHAQLRGGMPAQAVEMLTGLQAAATAAGDHALGETACRELARANLARARYHEAIVGFAALAADGDTPGAQLGQFELGLAHALNQEPDQALATWQTLAERPNLPPPLQLLCQGALGQISPDELASQAAASPRVIRALAYLLAARQTPLPAKRRRWQQQAAAAARETLPWLTCHLEQTASP